MFSSLPHRDVVTWNAILSAYVKQNQVYKALKLYRKMQDEGCKSTFEAGWERKRHIDVQKLMAGEDVRYAEHSPLYEQKRKVKK